MKNPGAVARNTSSILAIITDMITKLFGYRKKKLKEVSNNYTHKESNQHSNAPLKNNYLTNKRNLYTANMSQNGLDQSQLAQLRNDSSLKAINLTDEEWLSLATFAYANIMNETEANTIYQNKTIKEIDQILDNKTNLNIGYGSISDQEHRANLDKMANNTKLANFTLGGL